MLYWILYSGNTVICKASCPKDSEDIENLLSVGYVEVSEQEYNSAEVQNIDSSNSNSNNIDIYADIAKAIREGVDSI